MKITKKKKKMKLYTETLNQKDYAPFGYVIEARGDFLSANGGTAQRFNRLSELINLRNDAKPNVCLFRCKAREFNPFTYKIGIFFLFIKFSNKNKKISQTFFFFSKKEIFFFFSSTFFYFLHPQNQKKHSASFLYFC